ncbi:unnamed protein product [Umbelopsis vinacea]
MISTEFLAITLALLVTMAMAYSNNCHGSGRCNKNMGGECTSASNRYIDGHEYGQYTSKVFGHCTAIYECSSTYPSLSGSDIKVLFGNIYGN